MAGRWSRRIDGRMGLRLVAFFASPDSNVRLRIDQEHRAIEWVLQDSLDTPISFLSKHAATFGDVLSVLTRESFDIVQFSAHGTEDYLLFEEDGDSPVGRVTLENIAAVLERTQPSLRLALFMSCYSADALRELRRAAPYVITVSGPGDDELCLKFVKAFYSHFSATLSVDRAFDSAEQLVSYWRGDEDLPTLAVNLGRRAELLDSTHKVEVRMKGGSATVDLRPCLDDLTRLGITYPEFAEAVSRKLQLHEWIFRAALGSATIGVGAYIGEFRWQNPDDVVTCVRVLAVREDVPQEACQVLMDLLVRYNDLSVAPYRQALAPASVENVEHLQASLAAFRLIAEPADSSERPSPFSGLLLARVQEHLPQSLWSVPVASMRSSISMASTKLAAGQRAETVAYLENALSSLHDLVRAAVAQLCESPVGPDRCGWAHAGSRD